LFFLQTEFHVSFSNNLLPSSFTAECYAILEALRFISNAAPNNYLISSDSMSCLQSLTSNPFNTKLSPLVPGHVGILYGNAMADSLDKSSSNIILPPLATLP
ncbi:RNase H domain-containing protein, partial [Aphis craccivora]